MPHRTLKILALTPDTGVVQLLKTTLASIYSPDAYIFQHETDAAKALKIAREQRHIFCFVDTDLPGTGVQWIAQVRREGLDAALILVTSKSRRRDDMASLQMGADDYILKDTLTDETLEKSIRYSQQRRRIEQLANAQQVRLSEVLRASMLGEIAGSIAHEINNPLVVVSGQAQIIQAWATKPETFQAAAVSKSAQTIINNADRITKIVRGLRNMSMGSSLDKPEKVSLNKVIQEAIEFCQGRFTSGGVKLRTQMPEDFQIECRPHEILQVLVNILKNAVDAIQSLPERWIEITTTARSQGVEVRITDSGQGIAEEHQQKVFDRYYSTKKKGMGFGLGLDISKMIVDSHKGELFYNAESPHTQFIIRLPLEDANVRLNANQKFSMLIAEDDPDILNILTLGLKVPGVEILPAKDGLQAISFLESRPIDLVLTDLNLPGASGMEVYKEASKNKENKTQVAFITGFMDQSLRRSLDPDTPVFMKPFNIVEIKNYVKKILSLNQ